MIFLMMFFYFCAALALKFDAKAHFHQAQAELAIAKDDDVLEGFGAVIKRLNLAKAQAEAAAASAKARATRVDDAALVAELGSLVGEIEALLAPTVRSNSSIYFEKVDTATLAVVAGKVLVKVEPYAMDSTVEGALYFFFIV
jgi:hypothetical protein